MHRIPTIIKLGLIVVAALVLLAPTATSSQQSYGSGDSLYLSIKGATQGTITGGVNQNPVKGWIAVDSWVHEIVSPRDAASGLPTGKRQHKPIVITKSIDKATPKLYQALANNENLTTVELRFYGPSATGASANYFTVKLQNANIASIRNFKDETLDREVEMVSLTYQKITWIWVDGGITAEDDWESPVT